MQLWEKLTRGQSTNQNIAKHLPIPPSLSPSPVFLSLFIPHWLFAHPSPLWRSVHPHLERQLCSWSSFTPPARLSLSLPPLSVSASWSARCLRLPWWKSDCTVRRCWRLTVKQTRRSRILPGLFTRLVEEVMAATSFPSALHLFPFWIKKTFFFYSSLLGSPAPGLTVTGYVEILPPTPAFSSSSALPTTCIFWRKGRFNGFGMTEILVSDVNLNSMCERLEQQCCVDQNQHNLSSQPQTPVLKRHSNTGAKLWGRVRSKLLRQKVWHAYTSCFLSAFYILFAASVPLHSSRCHFHLFVQPLFYSQRISVCSVSGELTLIWWLYMWWMVVMLMLWPG